MAAGYTAVTFNLHVLQAQGLSQKDIFGYSDPYVVINTENRNKGCPWEPSSRSVRTKTCKRTLNPVWNEQFTLKFDPQEEFVVLDVFDENRITRDDFLGRIVLTQEYLSNVGMPRCSVQCVLEKRSERSNVSGTILLGIDFSNPDNSYDEPAEEEVTQVAADSMFYRMFYRIIENDHLHTIVTAAGVEGRKIYVHRYQARVTMDRERRELILPFTTDYQILRKLVLLFFFKSENIIEGNFQEAFKGALEKVFEDRVMVERLKEKLNIRTRSELEKIDLRLESGGGGGVGPCEIRYNSRYRTLILPVTAWPDDLLSTRAENLIEQIFADLKHWTIGPISEPDQTEDHQLSITRGQFGEEGPVLPAGWDWRRDQNGRILYVDHTNQRTTFNRPQLASAHEPEALPEMEMRRASYRRVVSHEDESQWVPQPHPDQQDEPDQADHQLSEEAEAEDAGVTNEDAGWEMRFTKEGKPFYVDHTTSTTSWECPADNEAIKSQLSSDIGDLPEGWEEKKLPNGKMFYVDHNRKITTWEDPRFSMTGLDVPKYSSSYKKKSSKLLERIKALQVRQRTDINVRRERVVEDSLHQIKKIAATRLDQLRGKLWIDFMGEVGQDFGGVAREWFLLLSTKLFNPYYGLFEYSANDVYTLQINPDSGVYNEHHLEFFHFIGRIVGMAVFHKKLVNGFFIRPFYSMMLGKKICLEDMQYVDEFYYNSLVHILDNDPQDYGMTFQVSYTRLGETIFEDLVPRGEEIPVTNQNKLEYIDKVVQWRFVSRVKKQMDSFMAGFEDVIPRSYIQNFDEGELELLMSGVGSINIKDWRDNTEYKNYSENDKVILWFWRAVLSFGDARRSKLLQFVTGTSRVPMNGFAELQGSDGPKRFKIEKIGEYKSLPRAHTCFNRLDLPEYRSYEELRSKIITAIEGSEGFDGVD